MKKLDRREILRGFAIMTTAVAAQASGLIPEVGLLRANGATMSLDAGARRRLRGRVMSSAEIGRAIGASHSRLDGRALWSYAARRGFKARPDQATAIDASWDGGEYAGSVTMVPLVLDASSERAMLVYRATPKSEVVGLAVSQSDGWVTVFAAANGLVLEEARFQQQHDRTILFRTPDGKERVLAAPPTSSVGTGGRAGLAAPLAIDFNPPTCSTYCGWILQIVCHTFVALTAIFVCAAVTTGTFGSGLVACGLAFVVVDFLVCGTVPDWACSQLCG